MDRWRGMKEEGWGAGIEDEAEDALRCLMVT